MVTEAEIMKISRPLSDLIQIDSNVRLSQPYPGYDSFNMSIMGDVCCFRSSNFRPKSNAAGKHSFLSVAKVSNGQLTDIKKVDHRGFNVPLWDRYNGMEDPKLFTWRGQTWCLFVRPSHSIDRIGMRMLSLDTGESHVLPDPLGRSHSKNWMPWVSDDRLLLVVDVDPLRIYEFDGNVLSPIHVSSSKSFDFLVHGGSNVVEIEAGLVGMVHGRFEISRGNWFYWHALCVLSDQLDSISVGKPFFFEDRQIEFCLSIDIQDGVARIPYSVDDATINILDVKTDQIGFLT